MHEVLEPAVWLAPLSDPTFTESEVHIWKAYLSQSPEIVREMTLLLSQEERNRAERFLFERDKTQFTLSRGIRRQLLAWYLRCPARNVEFDVGPKGKPSVRCHPELRFSLSHSNGLVLFALSMQCELGIDLEKVQTEFSSFDVVDHWFSAAEKAEFLALPLHLRNLAFYLGWTRKEAYLKARGEGLHMKLEDFDVSMDPARPALLNSEDAPRWKMRSFCPDPEFVATLVAEGAHCELRCREWSLAPNV